MAVHVESVRRDEHVRDERARARGGARGGCGGGRLPIAEAKRLVAQAYALRQERKFPMASKTLRAAQASDPLDAWSAVERTFLEENGEGAVEAAREGRANPDMSVSLCRTAYLQIGATNEVHLIDRQLK